MTLGRLRQFAPRIAVCAVMGMAVSVHAKAPSSQDTVPQNPTSKDAVLYETVFDPSGISAVDQGLKASSLLLSLQKTRVVGPYALAGRIRGDYERLMGALRSQGYYAGRVSISIEGLGQTLDGQDPLLATLLARNAPGKTLTLRVRVVLGERFRIGRISFDSAKPNDGDTSGMERQFVLNEQEKKALGLKEGDPAVAGNVLAAVERLQNILQEEGHALSTVSPPKAVLERTSYRLDIRIQVVRGPKVAVGPVRMHGLRRVKEDYVRKRLLLKEGQLYQPSVIEAARMDLGSRGLFSSVTVENKPPLVALGPQASAVAGLQQAMPLSFDMVEGKRRRIAAEAGYSTDLGGRVGVSWLHRNILGRGERLRLSALATGLGGTAQQGLGYDVLADFNKPDFMQRDRNLNLHAEAVRQLLYSYKQTAWLLRGGVSQPLGRNWTVSGALMLEQEAIRQFGIRRHYFIVSLPFQATYDTTHRKNPIEPATHGVRVTVGITPSESLENQTSFFLPMTLQASTYIDLARLGIARPGRSVIALRGLVGSIQGASTWDIPPDQRLYAGGPATVRGFRYQGVGPQQGKYAIGGTSVDAGTVELRQRVYHNIGMALFADAGQVGTSSMPGHGKLRVGYGGGVRYFTPIGPIRVDVALPMNRPYRGDKWELYIGLGETF